MLQWYLVVDATELGAIRNKHKTLDPRPCGFASSVLGRTRLMSGDGTDGASPQEQRWGFQREMQWSSSPAARPLSRGFICSAKRDVLGGERWGSRCCWLPRSSSKVMEQQGRKGKATWFEYSKEENPLCHWIWPASGGCRIYFSDDSPGFVVNIVGCSLFC